MRLRAGVVAGAGDFYALVPQTNILAEWRFEEGSGNTVADSSGNGNDIDLTLPTDPNATWNGRGILLASGCAGPGHYRRQNGCLSLSDNEGSDGRL